MTRPPAPWIHEDIRNLQQKRDYVRKEANQTNSSDAWAAFRAMRNEIKGLINKTRKAFLSRALSSKRPKDV